MAEKGSLTVISGFSGAGKGTVIQALLRQHEEYVESVSVTTRKPRPGEQEGVSYFFISEDQFDQMAGNGELLEYARYVNHGYGTPRAFVEENIRAGKDVILEIEVQGAMQVKEKWKEANLLFIVPPSARELLKRLKKRGTESDEEVTRRIIRACDEAKEMEQYDYIVVNDDVQKTVEEVHEIIQASKAASQKQTALIKRLNRELEELSLSLKKEAGK